MIIVMISFYLFLRAVKQIKGSGRGKFFGIDFNLAINENFLKCPRTANTSTIQWASTATFSTESSDTVTTASRFALYCCSVFACRIVFGNIIFIFNGSTSKCTQTSHHQHEKKPHGCQCFLHSCLVLKRERERERINKFH